MKKIARYIKGFDGAPARVSYTFKTDNSKTGNMIQQWITPKDWEQSKKINQWASETVCNNCPLIKQCYVKSGSANMGLKSTSKSVNQIEGSELDHLKKFRGRGIRFGAFGEPVLAGLEATKSLVKVARTWTGYTHQHHKLEFNWAKEYFMASVESEKLKAEANAKGWKTFRVGQPGDKPLPDEVMCPASAEAGKLTTCDHCGLCRGTSSKGKNVFIYEHD